MTLMNAFHLQLILILIIIISHLERDVEHDTAPTQKEQSDCKPTQTVPSEKDGEYEPTLTQTEPPEKDGKHFTVINVT